MMNFLKIMNGARTPSVPVLRNFLFFALLLCSALPLWAVSYPTTAFLSDSTFTDASICDGEQLQFGAQLLDSSGVYTETFVASDGSDSTVVLTLTVLPTSETLIEAGICNGDAYNFQGSLLSTAGVYTDTLPGLNGCDSVLILQLSVFPLDTTLLHIGICDGSAYYFQGDTLNASGSYEALLSNANGCDSLVVLQLDVVDHFETQVDATICANETYPFAGTLLSDAGTYLDTVLAQGGCDSVLILNLQVLPVFSSSFQTSICANQYYAYNGDTLTTAGDHVYILKAGNGCDSTVTLQLEVLPVFESEIVATICANQAYAYNGDTLTAAGDYVYILQAGNGCDSTVTVHLDVLPVFESAFQATICANESYAYNGDTLSTAGDYVFTLQAGNGCDSTVTLQLEVLPVFGSSFQASICANGSYTYNGDTLNTAGNYTFVYQAGNGCDSTVTLQLEVLPIFETEVLASICANEFYVYNGDTLTTAGDYTFVYQAGNGCDSTVNVLLEVLPVFDSEIQATICANESYAFNGENLNVAGDYSVTYQTVNGCDSTVTLHLDVLPVFETDIQASICAEDFYSFNGDQLNTSGTYAALLSGVNGCDSLVRLELTVFPKLETSLSFTTCSNEPFPYQGQILTSSGLYEFTLISFDGCDSLIHLELTVLDAPITQLSASICSNESFSFNGEELATSGEYTAVLAAENGCDSTVVLNLDVRPVSAYSYELQICSNATYPFNGEVLDSSGIYTAHYTSANGCDSLVTLYLSLADTLRNVSKVSICEGQSYAFETDVYTASGNYTYMYTSVDGCDSLVILQLTVLPPQVVPQYAEICGGTVYQFNGEALSLPGVYTATYSSSAGCDSTVVLTLEVRPEILPTAIEATICSGSFYLFDGVELTESGTYPAVFTSASFCDSVVNLTLTVVPVLGSQQTVSICAGETYSFYGQVLSDAGVYSTVLSSQNGCDSTIYLTLTVLPTSASNQSATICAGESYPFNGMGLTIAGAYSVVLSNQNGCDSTVNLVLSVLPTSSSNITASICDGESYGFNGQVLTQSGQYSSVLSNAFGCDSIVVLTLTVHPNYAVSLAATICEGESFNFGGQLLTTAGVYTSLLSTVNGCDSTVTLNLTVNTVSFGVSVQSGTLTVSAANASYQWIDCDTNQPIPNATGSSFTPQVTGSYAVQVTQNGCTRASDCILVEVVGASNLASLVRWTVMPNPASDHATVMLEAIPTDNSLLEMFDPMGRLLFSQAIPAGAQSIQIDLNEMPSGLIFVRLSANGQSAIKQLLKSE